MRSNLAVAIIMLSCNGRYCSFPAPFPPSRLVVPSPCSCSVACFRMGCVPYPVLALSLSGSPAASLILQERTSVSSSFFPGHMEIPTHRAFLLTPPHLPSPPFLLLDPFVIVVFFSSNFRFDNTQEQHSETPSQTCGPPSAAQPRTLISPQTHLAHKYQANCRGCSPPRSPTPVSILS